MDLKDRLLKIMNIENMSSAIFADTIGVQRSSISHIISGRNKPSLDFIQKLLSAFPKYRAEWLIMGTGSIYKQQQQGNLFDNIKKSEEKQENPVDDTKQQIKIEKQEQNTQTEQITINNNSISNKKTSKIVIFYSDNTFTEYYPE